MSGWSLSAQEAAAAVDGRLELIGGGGLADTTLRGVGTDTRVDLTGLLFIALRGENYDAHDFLRGAIEKGANGLLVRRELAPEERRIAEEKSLANGMPIAVIVVDDTLIALQALSRHWRHKCRAMILGITGSNGKTSTKEFTAALLASRLKVQWSKGSFNNHWGVPLSLLSISPDHDVAVIEMGMNHPGELKTLSKIAEADAVVCTMVGRGHLEGVGSLEGVAAAKSEIYEFAPQNATFIFNLSNEYTAQMMAKFTDDRRRTLTFAEAQDEAHEAGGDVSFAIVEATAESLTVAGTIKGVAGRAVVPVYGRHNVTNLMAASALALVAGLSPQEIWAALPNCRAAWGRNQWVQLKSGARALFDGYNANPESMKAAIENASLLRASGGRVIAVLAEMKELGDGTAKLHQELGEQVATAGFDELVFIGPSHGAFGRGLGGKASSAILAPQYDPEVARALRERLKKDDIVLIKGSRGMSLEIFLKALDPVDFELKK